MRRPTSIAIAVIAAALAAMPAAAQKSKDLFRFSLTTPLKSVDFIYFPLREMRPIYSGVYEALIISNDYEKRYLPLLAKSWQRTGPTTLEFELRDDVVFHSGNKMTAKDVATTVNFAADPKVNFVLKNRYSWLKNAEVLGPYKVRITAKRPLAIDLARLASLPIIDSAVQAKLDDKSNYGRVSPVGTGPYKVTSLDVDKGVVISRNDTYRGPAFERATIGHIKGVPIPDRETQIAELITGNIDALRDPAADQIKNLSRRPDLEVSARDSFTHVYMQLDAINRSGRKELTDVRVRRALFMAVDRKALKDNFVPGGEAAQIIDTICSKIMQACEHSVDPVRFDPESARKLLAEAGYPDGFAMTLIARPNTRAMVTAIAGNLRKIGIKADIQTVNVVTMRKLRRSGKLEAYIGERPTSMADAANAVGIYFSSPSRDYWRDPIIKEAMKKGNATHDLAVRTGYYKTIFDRINDQAYMLPIATIPIVFIHSKDVKLLDNPLSPANISAGDFAWN